MWTFPLLYPQTQSSYRITYSSLCRRLAIGTVCECGVRFTGLISKSACLCKSFTLHKGSLNTGWQFHVQINLISTGSEKCTSHIQSLDQAGGRCLSSQNYKKSFQTDMNLQLVSSWRLLKVCDSVWGSTKGHVCEAMNFLRQAMIPQRLYLGRITSTARYNLTFVPQGSHTALLTNDSVTVGLCPQWNRLKRTKHVFAVECRSARQI